MLESLRIENFKCFESFAVEDLRRLTLIGGQNNVGKTAILDALYLYLARTSEQRVFGPYARRGLIHLELRSEIAWAPLFRAYDLKQKILISTTRNGDLDELCISLTKNFSPPALAGISGSTPGGIRTDQPATSTDALAFTDNSGNKAFLFLDEKTGPILYVERQIGVGPVSYVGTRSHPVKGDPQAFGELDRTGQAERVVRVLQIIEPNLEDLAIIPLAGHSVIHGGLRGFPVKIPIALMGEGLARLLSIMLAMAQSPNGVVLIDEIENGFHYSVQAKMWKAIAEAAAELKCQVFATTHSYEFLRHAQEALAGGEYANDFRYIRLERNAKGGHVAKSYDIETVRTAVEMGLEVR